MQSDAEAVVEALVEVRRLIDLRSEATTRQSQEEILRMLEYIVAAPELTRAILRLKMRSRLRAVV